MAVSGRPDHIVPQQQSAVTFGPQQAHHAAAADRQALSSAAGVGTKLSVAVSSFCSIVPEGKLTVSSEIPETEAEVGVVPKKLAQVVAADRNSD